MFKTVLEGFVSKLFKLAERSTVVAVFAATVTTIGDPPLKAPVFAGWDIVTVAAEEPAAILSTTGTSVTWPEVTSGGANQKSVPDWAKEVDKIVKKAKIWSIFFVII